MVTRGSYCLCIKVDRDSTIRIGSLGVIKFSKGKYVYVGSALNSLIPRLSRHIRTSKGEGKVAHWHIDYLLREPNVELSDIYATDWAVRIECEIAAKISEQGRSIPRFGCSDCDCKSHLFNVKTFEFIKDLGLKRVNLSSFAFSPSPL